MLNSPLYTGHMIDAGTHVLGVSLNSDSDLARHTSAEHEIVNHVDTDQVVATFAVLSRHSRQHRNRSPSRPPCRPRLSQNRRHIRAGDASFQLQKHKVIDLGATVVKECSPYYSMCTSISVRISRTGGTVST
jgi:hypothetical protein